MSVNGARFLRCDLHMHTPFDKPRWQGTPMGDGDEERKEVAREYIRACYEAELDLVAITDHNFASKEFIPVLKNAAKDLEGEYARPLFILPGFEIMADVGKGLHVLAIFSPAADLDIVDHMMTECGITQPRFQDSVPVKSTMRLREILEKVQSKSPKEQRGIVIYPHCQGDAGIFDNDRLSDWLQAEEFKNPDLSRIAG